MDICNAIIECLTGPADEADTAGKRTTQELTTEVLNTLYKAEKKGRTLKQDLQDIVSDYGWTENLATAILNGLESALKAGAPMGQAMKEAFEKATKEAADFAHDHPVFCTLIALGILAILVPWAVVALGFGELGPVEGKSCALFESCEETGWR
jgi:hypothetical protein